MYEGGVGSCLFSHYFRITLINFQFQIPQIVHSNQLSLSNMSLAEKLEMVLKGDGEYPPSVQLPMLMLEVALNRLINSSSAKINTAPMIASFSEVLKDYGGNTLLNIIGHHLPVETRKSVALRAPPPLTKPWCLLTESYVSLLNVLANSGPAQNAEMRGVTLHRHQKGLLVKVFLAESTDGVALSKGLGYDMINDTVTGFTAELTEEQLLQLAGSTPEQVDQFVESHPMVGDAYCTIFTGVSGTASSLVGISYRAKLGTAEDIANYRKPLMEMVKQCCCCLVDKTICVRPDPNGPCNACCKKNRTCIIGEVMTFSSDCESGKTGREEYWILFYLSFSTTIHTAQYTFMSKAEVTLIKLPDPGHLVKLYRNGKNLCIKLELYEHYRHFSCSVVPLAQFKMWSSTHANFTDAFGLQPYGVAT